MLTYAVYLITDGRSTTFRILVELVAVSSQSYPKTLIVLFCITCKIISHQFRLIVDQIKNISPNSFNTVEVSNQLNCLQHYHGVICNSNVILNECFGSILFFEILFIFVGLINTAMSILIHYGNYTEPFFWTMTGILLTDHIIRVSIICLSAESIANRVTIESICHRIRYHF